jgi:predicted transcriptional regulator
VAETFVKGLFVTTNSSIRAGLTNIHVKERGALKKFSARHELNYNYLYRIITGNISSPSYESGSKILDAINLHNCEQEKNDG